MVECPRCARLSQQVSVTGRIRGPDEGCFLCGGASEVDEVCSSAYLLKFEDRLPSPREIQDLLVELKESVKKNGFGAVSVHLVPKELRAEWLKPKPLASRFAMLRKHSPNADLSDLIRQIWELWEEWRV